MCPADNNEVDEEFKGLVLKMPNGLDPEWIHDAPPRDIDESEGTIMENLLKDEKWDEFLDHLISDVDDPDEMMVTESFIRKREYRSMVEKIVDGTYEFPIPTRVEIPKPGTNKTRKIYTFKSSKNVAEHTVIRMMAWQLNRYSYLFAPNLYSCSDNDGVRGAINSIIKFLGDGDKYCYKADLSDFFNSIDISLLFDELYAHIDKRDHGVIKVLEKILKNPTVRVVRLSDVSAKPTYEEDNYKGVMAGMPFASFLSNYFLRNLDWLLFLNRVPFFRYADDMMVVAETSERLDEIKDFIQGYVDEKKLILNPNKVSIYQPGEEFIFLGIRFDHGRTMLSEASIKKHKARIKTMARKYRKRYEDGKVTRETAMALMIRAVNSFHYGSDVMPYCFTKMYFPLITSSENLGIIDNYVQECIRYVYIGKFKHSNRGKLKYYRLKMLGYLPLVSAYRIYRDLWKH
ncbi:MAG: hypothetical protein MJZ21_05895 [archaeon]|nr:hypothetical protein [archaeon]